MNISFFTPVCFVSNKSYKEYLIEKVDDYFYLEGKKAEVISFDKENSCYSIRLISENPSLISLVLKIVSYITVIIPIIALSLKLVIRSYYQFSLDPHTSSIKLNEQREKLSEASVSDLISDKVSKKSSDDQALYDVGSSKDSSNTTKLNEQREKLSEASTSDIIPDRAGEKSSDDQKVPEVGSSIDRSNTARAHLDKPINLDEQISSAERLDKNVIGSSSETAKIKLKDGTILFWKATRNFGDGLSSYREVAGSRIANFLTGNLVPLATETTYEGVPGVSYPWVTLDTKWFRSSLKSDGLCKIDFSSLNELQKHQLFVHILTDRLISNWDTHNHQYGMDENGSIVSFDKEMAFEGFFLRNEKGERIPKKPFELTKKEPITRVAMDENFWWLTPEDMNNYNSAYRFINFVFIRQVKSNEIKIDLYHPVLRDFFDKCDAMSELDVFEKCRVYGEKAFGDKADDFHRLIHRRVRCFRNACHNFFGWEKIKTNEMPTWEDESIFTPIKSLDHDFNLQSNFAVLSERNVEEIRKKLHEKEHLDRSLHVGFSGYYNYDIAYERKSGCILLLDSGNNARAIFKATEKLMAIASNRFDFVDKLTSKIIKKQNKYFSNLNTLIADQIKQKLLSSGWLSQDASFEWIKQKYLEKKIAFIRVDMRKPETFEKLGEFIVNHFNVDTFYAANILDKLSSEEGNMSEEYSLDAYQNIRRIISDKTLVIDANNKTDIYDASY